MLVYFLPLHLQGSFHSMEVDGHQQETASRTGIRLLITVCQCAHSMKIILFINVDNIVIPILPSRRKGVKWNVGVNDDD